MDVPMDPTGGVDRREYLGLKQVEDRSCNVDL
jgi:hypothetical protein